MTKILTCDNTTIFRPNFSNIRFTGEFSITDSPRYGVTTPLFPGIVTWKCTSCRNILPVKDITALQLDLVQTNKFRIPYNSGVLYVCPCCFEPLYIFGLGDIAIYNDREIAIINMCNWLKKEYDKQENENNG